MLLGGSVVAFSALPAALVVAVVVIYWSDLPRKHVVQGMLPWLALVAEATGFALIWKPWQ